MIFFFFLARVLYSSANSHNPIVRWVHPSCTDVETRAYMGEITGFELTEPTLNHSTGQSGL